MILTLIISSILLWITVLFTLLLLLALIRRVTFNESTASAAHEHGLPIGSTAPHFRAITLEGEPVSLATYAGRKVMFIFMGADCSVCHDLLPTLDSLIPKATQAGVSLVLVSTSSIERTRSWISNLHFQMPVIVAPFPDNSFMEDYAVPGTPGYCLVGSEGVVESAGYPGPNSGEWRKVTDSWSRGITAAPSINANDGRLAMA